MPVKEHDTEKAILAAAKIAFIHKGFAGARMQEIADTAGINKALLHYYFRSKDRLFEAIFRQAVTTFFPPVFQVFQTDIPFPEKLVQFIYAYIDVLIKNPHIPAFVLHEINANPQRFVTIIKDSGVQPETILKQIKAEVYAGRIHPVKPEHLLMNLFSMCVYPFIARPVTQAMLNMPDKDYDIFLEARKSEVVNFILQAIIVK